MSNTCSNTIGVIIGCTILMVDTGFNYSLSRTIITSIAIALIVFCYHREVFK